MSNNHDTMKKLMETVDGKRPAQTSRLTETIITEGDAEAYEVAAELLDIGEQIENLMDEAKVSLNQLGPEGRSIKGRAEAYWISHILGAVALNNQSTSMTSMAETIEELENMGGGREFDDMKFGSGHPTYSGPEDERDPMEAVDIIPTLEDEFGDDAFFEGKSK